MQGSPSELRVEVTGMRLYLIFPVGSSISFLVLGADNLPLIRKLVRTKRQFFVTVIFQGVAKKLASAKFDGQIVKWNKEFDALCALLF